METEFNIPNAELAVMRVIWSLGEARVDEVSRQIAHKFDWSLATIKTLLGRLVKKGMLSTEKEGRKFVYRPLIAENDAILRLSDNLLSKVCATKQPALLADMIESSSLTKADVERLISLLQEKQTVESVDCTCLEDFGACSCQHQMQM